MKGRFLVQLGYIQLAAQKHRDAILAFKAALKLVRSFVFFFFPLHWPLRRSSPVTSIRKQIKTRNADWFVRISEATCT